MMTVLSEEIASTNADNETFLLVKWLWYWVYNKQKVAGSSPRVSSFFYLYSICLSYYIRDVLRPLSNDI